MHEPTLRKMISAFVKDFGALPGYHAKYPEAGLQRCLERSRYEQAHERTEGLQNNLAYAHTEVKQLRHALVKYRRNPLRRLWWRVMQIGAGFRVLWRVNQERNEIDMES